MPSKVRLNAVAINSAGFLKPTFSSRSKAVGKCDGKTQESNARHGEMKKLKDKTEINNNSVASESAEEIAPTYTNAPHLYSSPSSSSISESSFKLSQPTKDSDQTATHPSDVDVDPLSSSPVHSSAVRSNDAQIADARKICEDLRRQIEDLKLQQKQFSNRLGEDNVCGHKDVERQMQSADDGITIIKSTLNECRNCSEPASNNEDIALGCSTRKNKSNVEKTNIENYTHKLNGIGVDPKISTSEDNFTLHGSVTSSDIHDLSNQEDWPRGVPKDATPKKVIKRLVSEKEHYKRKVKQLQSALHRLKKQALSSNSRSPDISAHDIVYYNADLIGEGHMSYVFSGTLYKEQAVAIKKLVRPDLMSNSDRSYMAAEAGLVMTLHHRNIVEVFGVSTAPLQPLIVTEIVLGKNLNDKLHSPDAWPLSPSEYYSISRDVCIGMAYLHGQKPPVLHLNLRPCNILLDANGCAKVTDFGFSKIRVSNPANLAYVAPELLQFPVHLTTKLDVYSFAIILWEMASMTIPYKDQPTSEIFDKISCGKRLGIPTELPSVLHALISRSWDQSPLQRPSFKELIILLETMTLPVEWEEAIEKSAISRADTKGLITPRDRATVIAKESSKTQSSKDMTIKPNTEVNYRKTRRKISDELALENDMLSMGYGITKPEGQRNGSSFYVNGFQREREIQHFSSSNGYRSPWRRSVSQSPSNRRNVLRMSPAAAPFQISYFSPSPHAKHRHGLNGIHESPAARNLSREFADSEAQGKWKRDEAQRNMPEAIAVTIQSKADGIENKPHRGQKGSRGKSRESTSSSESTHSQNNGKAGPEPLTDRDLRIVDQDLIAGTPEVVTGRSLRKLINSGSCARIVQPRYSEEDLRTAVSIPYLKNLRSGDETSTNTGASTPKSEFDVKLETYVSGACDSESRNDVHGRYPGWTSSRSNILNRDGTISSADHIKVKSIGTIEADRIFTEGRKGQASSVPTAWSESTESLMTAVYKPLEEHRQKLLEQGQSSSGNKEMLDELNGSTFSDNSCDEMQRVGVASFSSTTGISAKHRHSNSDPRNSSSQHSTDKLLELGVKNLKFSKAPQHNLVQRSKSWNKLKNSYSPESYMPHQSTGFDASPTVPRVHLPLPPSLSPVQIRDRYGASSKSWSESNEPGGRRRNRSSRKSDKAEKSVVYSRSLSDDQRHKRHQTNDGASGGDVENTLRETAADLAGISEVLEVAANVHEREAIGAAKESS